MKIAVRLNPQQESLLSKLVDENVLEATSVADLVACAFDDFWLRHPELHGPQEAHDEASC